MKPKSTSLFVLTLLLFTVQVQAQKTETIPSNGKTYTASDANNTDDPDYTGYLVSNPHSGIFVVDSGNGHFNCHAFAWPNDTTVWVNSTNDSSQAPQIYYNHFSNYYYTPTDSSKAEIAVYGDSAMSNPIHSAVRLTNTTSTNPFARAFLAQYPQYAGWYISKWDGGPLVIHQLDSCPFYKTANHVVTFFKKSSESSTSNYIEYSSSFYSIVGRQKVVCSSPGTPFWLSSTTLPYTPDTITSFPQGYKIKWTSSSTITLSPNDSAYPVTASFNATGNDTGHISATIYFPNGTSGSVGPFNVWEGPPASITSISTSQFTAGGNGEETITVSSSWAEFYAWPFNTADVVPPSPTTYDTHGASSYWWTCSSGGGPAITFNQDVDLDGYRYAAGGFTPSNEYGIITVRAYNACGSATNFQSIYESSSDDIVYSMAPNPASNVLTINVTPTGPAAAASQATQAAASAGTTPAVGAALPATPLSYTLKIVDLSGTMYYTSTQTTNKFTIPVGNLTPGNYIVILSDGKRASSKNLVVQH